MGFGVTATASERVELHAGARLVTITTTPAIGRTRPTDEHAADRTLKRAFCPMIDALRGHRQARLTWPRSYGTASESAADVGVMMFTAVLNC